MHAIAVEGTFDDCQALVKAMFNHAGFRDELQLSGVNSINWARIAAQTVYYFTAAAALGGPHRPVSFRRADRQFRRRARRLGRQAHGPARRAADGRHQRQRHPPRTLASGTYEVRGVTPTTSPSMDIQVSSNFERLLFEAYGRDRGRGARASWRASRSRAPSRSPEPLARIRAEFASAAVDEDAVAAEIGATWTAAGYLLDPHTAVGVRAARGAPRATARDAGRGARDGASGEVPDAVERATGVRPRCRRISPT